MTENIKISVITPVLNNVRFIEDAIKSVLNQDYSNFEHIIIDGGSTDGTIEILKKYKHLIWISEPDTGQSNAMNKGFKISTGQVIVYLNADDYINPGAFHTVIPYFIKGAKFVVGKIKVLESGKEQINDTKIKHEEILRYWEQEAFCVNPVGYYYCREVQEAVNGFNEDDHYTMDHAFFLAASKLYSFEKIKEDIILGVFRYIKGTKTSHFMKSNLFFNYKIRSYIDNYLKEMPKDYRNKFKKDRKQFFIKKKIEYYKKKSNFFTKILIKIYALYSNIH